MGHLFDVDGVSVANPGGFLNLGAIGDSWSADGFIEPQSHNEYKFVYVSIRSYTGIAQPFDSHAAWAVHDGDVGNAVVAVPEAGSYAMMLGGLLAAGCCCSSPRAALRTVDEALQLFGTALLSPQVSQRVT